MADSSADLADLRKARGHVLVNRRDPYLGVHDEENERDPNATTAASASEFRPGIPPACAATSVISPMSRGNPTFKMIPWREAPACFRHWSCGLRSRVAR